MSNPAQDSAKAVISKLQANSQNLQQFFSERHSTKALQPQEIATLVDLNAKTWASEEIFHLLKDDLLNLPSLTPTEAGLLDMVNRLMVLSADWAGRRGTSLTSMWVLSETIHDLKNLYGQLFDSYGEEV